MGNRPGRLDRGAFACIPDLLAVALGACQSPPGSGATSPQLERILASGELRAGLSGDQAPLNMRNRKGELIGLEVEVAEGVVGQEQSRQSRLAALAGAEERHGRAAAKRAAEAFEGGEAGQHASEETMKP